VTLYDLTNTYLEGEMAGNPKARRGHSEEKRSDGPLGHPGPGARRQRLRAPFRSLCRQRR
jgi:hypothetical protein